MGTECDSMSIVYSPLFSRENKEMEIPFELLHAAGYEIPEVYTDSHLIERIFDR